MARQINPRRSGFELPVSPDSFTDKYFLRSRKILEKEGINPIVKYRVFVQQGPGVVCGLDEAIAIIKKYSCDLSKIKVRALFDGEPYAEKETIMEIEGPVQDLIVFETMILGVISTGSSIASQMAEICDAAKGKDVFYFGARHARFDSDKEISYAAWVGGAKGVSTDIGASTFGGTGMGTIPHALVLCFGDTAKTTELFADCFEKESKVIALVDTYNKEITDSLKTAELLGERLYGIRLDTAWENSGEFCKAKGVSVELAVKTRKALDEHGFSHVKIFLSSVFNPMKVREFIEAEKKHGKFFDAIGTGSVFNYRIATMDMVERNGKPCHKTGRPHLASDRLKEVELNG